jgi:hypothetical protein
MVGVRTPEACWAVNNRQDNKLEKLLHLVGDLFELSSFFPVLQLKILWEIPISFMQDACLGIMTTVILVRNNPTLEFPHNMILFIDPSVTY